MPSTTSNLLTCLSSEISQLSHLRKRLIPRRKRSPVNEFPITRSSLAYHCERRRMLMRGGTDALYVQAPVNLEAAPALAFEISAGSNGTDDDAWSWADADERGFSVMAVVGGMSDTDLSAEEREEGWRQEWEEISTQLKEAAKKRAVVTTTDGRVEEEDDIGYCGYDYRAALEALREPEHGRERPEGKCGPLGSLNCAVSRSEEVRRRKRRTQGMDVDLAPRARPLREYSRDTGSMKKTDGAVACGDVWWRGW